MAHHEVLSPIPGTFYRKSSPEVEPFVKEGDAVRVGDRTVFVDDLMILDGTPRAAPGTRTGTCDGIDGWEGCPIMACAGGSVAIKPGDARAQPRLPAPAIGAERGRLQCVGRDGVHRQTDTMPLTPSVSICAPRPRAMISPRSITR